MHALVRSEDALAGRKRGRPERDMEPILLAAITIFAREGFAATTIEMIAFEAHVSSATLYKRFFNKQGLFEAVLAATTQRSLAIHMAHSKVDRGPFSSLLGRLEAHCLVSSDTQVRGVMRAWISEVSRHRELGELFARKSGVELAKAVHSNIDRLVEQGLVDLGEDAATNMLLAGQVMLGIVERFTLMRGLILGDDIAPSRPPENIAYLAVQAMVGIWGTKAGKRAFATVMCEPVKLSPCVTTT
jgi:AcrR family transcriptional regulator